ncbi:MAG: hypothetical protein ACFBWO_12555 [Paracoccaceae bacterium]
MTPHPSFADRIVPAEHRLGAFVLRALGIDDLDRDFTAVTESVDEIRAANPDSQWPDGLTRERDLIDLAWHQREFEARRSFAWVIEDRGGAYLGCAYVYPSIAGERAADVRWWWRAGTAADRDAFVTAFLDWLAGPDWPALDYRARSVRPA